MRCPNCNKKYVNDEKFCKVCGTELIEDNESEKKKIYVLLVLGISAILIITFVIAFLVKNGKSRKVALDSEESVESYEDDETEIEEDIETEEPAFDGDYEKLIQELEKSAPVKESDESKELYDLANAVSGCYLISKDESKDIQELTSEEVKFLMFKLIANMKLYKFSTNVQVDYLKERNEKPFYIELNKEGLNQLADEFIGTDNYEENFLLDGIYFTDLGDGWISSSMGEGEGLTELGEYKLYMNDSFYVLKAPIYKYGSSDGEPEIATVGVLTSVFEKTPDAQLCGKLVYISMKEDNIFMNSNFEYAMVAKYIQQVARHARADYEVQSACLTDIDKDNKDEMLLVLKKPAPGGSFYYHTLYRFDKNSSCPYYMETYSGSAAVDYYISKQNGNVYQDMMWHGHEYKGFGEYGWADDYIGISEEVSGTTYYHNQTSITKDEYESTLNNLKLADIPNDLDDVLDPGIQGDYDEVLAEFDEYLEINDIDYLELELKDKNCKYYVLNKFKDDWKYDMVSDSHFPTDPFIPEDYKTVTIVVGFYKESNGSVKMRTYASVMFDSAKSIYIDPLDPNMLVIMHECGEGDCLDFNLKSVFGDEE